MVILIEVWYNDGEMIDDTNDQERYSFDVSMARFEEILSQEIKTAYPGADVTITHNRGLIGACRSPEIDGQSGGFDGSLLDSIIERVYFAGEWMVRE